MAVKRKRAEPLQENENERHASLRSSRTPHKRIRHEVADEDVARKNLEDPTKDSEVDRPLKLLKVPKRKAIPRITSKKGVDPKDSGMCDTNTSSGSRTRHCVSQISNGSALDASAGATPRTRKRTNMAVVEISTPKRPLSKRELSTPSVHERSLDVPADDLSPHPKSLLVASNVNKPVIHPSFCLNAQKKEILRTLQTGTSEVSTLSTESEAQKQLSELLRGTVMRGEGNSCLVLGPRGSGKSGLVESCISNLSVTPIILRLSGWVQTTDKQALREIAIQLLQQTGSHFLLATTSSPIFENEDENPFIDNTEFLQDTSPMHVPPSSQLHALVPVLLTLKRSVIVILDAFDLFALHPRQSLLYCLLDNVQSCRATPENRGFAVIGITSRLDTIQLLEKRVKSRFSGRIIRTSLPSDLQCWLDRAKNTLLAPITQRNGWVEEWRRKWSSSIEEFFSDPKVLDVFRETFDISKDFKTLSRLLTWSVLQLKPNEPYLTFRLLSASVKSQRSRPPHTHVNNLSYPMICLVIAGIHADMTGHPTFNFEMLFENFHYQLRASTSAPVQVNGGQIGMVKCTRDVLLAAFDSLVSSQIFVPTVAPSATLAKEFVRHRCALEKEIVKRIVEKSGHIHLKKWFNKG